MKTKNNKILLIIVLLFFAALIWSVINPYDYFTWFLEVVPGVAGFIILALTFKKFRFTDFTYFLILIHCYILFRGGHTTYAEEPFFNWLKEVLGWSRNNYDKVGHFAQGFFPAIVIRELFVRQLVLAKKGWMFFVITSICLAISAIYEFIEAVVSMITGESADAFLGTQGYVWDTQTDMFMAMIGAMVALIALAKVHDKAIKKLENPA
jgi:putative membrane protein